MYRKFKADEIFTGEDMLPGNHVLITGEGGIIEDIVHEDEAGDDVEIFTGILSPGFINCHCHLELSHMKGMIPKHTGLVEFVWQVMNGRQADPHKMAAAIVKAEKEMLDAGIVAVGDICNNDSTAVQKSKQQLQYHNFIETSGFPPSVAETRFKRALELYAAFSQLSHRNSIVPHAPYSVSPALFEMIDQFPGNRLITIHNQETEAENVFFEYGLGDLRSIYEKMGIDISFFKASGKSSMQTWLPYINNAGSLILVHNVAASPEDISFQKSRSKAIGSQLYYCLCPNANLYITGMLPNITMLLQEGCSIVLGTDSLASNDQLSVLGEIKTVLKSFPGISVQTALGWATINGARALSIDDAFGSFEKGKKPGIVIIDREENGFLSQSRRVL